MPCATIFWNRNRAAKMIRQFSLKRQRTQKELDKVLIKIKVERGDVCEDCGYRGYVDASHNYSRKDFETLIADPENITLLCRRHHLAFENNQIWEMKTDRILRHMIEQYETEPDIFRGNRMETHFRGKLANMEEQAEIWEITLPKHCVEILKEFENKAHFHDLKK